MAEGSKAASPGSSGSCPYAPPSHHIAQPYEFSLAPTAAQIAELAGITLQDWQLDVLSDWAACRGDGKFVHRRNVASIPRQSGKSYVAVGWASSLALNGYHVLWSCHNYSTTMEMRKRFTNVFGSRPNDRFAKHPEFNAYVSAANNKTGQESFELSTGGVVAFSTRTASAALGYTFDVVFYDEAQELTDEQQQVILPTTTSGPMGNPQSVYIGTPLRPGRPGTVFARERASILSGEDPLADYSLWEWGVGEVGDIRDESRWAEANPSIGRVANIDAIRMALPPNMTELAFAQEYLGYWLPGAVPVESVIDAGDWEECEIDPRLVPQGDPTAYAVKFSPDGSVGSIALCIDASAPFVEVAANRSMRHGVAWFARWLAERADRAEAIVIDGKSNAQTLVDKLLEEGVDEGLIVRPSTADVIAANAAFVDATREHAVSHAGQPALAESATLSGYRRIGRDGGFGFESNENADATLVEACAQAYWCAMSIRRNPHQELRIG